MDEILGAFEEALELERELGTRTVECDRALLLPPQTAVPPPPPSPPPASPLRVSAPPRETAATPVPPPSAPPTPSLPSHPSSSAVADFAFIALRRPEGTAAELLAKMVAAMGYTMSTVVVTTAEEAARLKPRARVLVVLGSDAFRTFAPGQRASLGLWTSVHDVPTVVTYSPARILSYFRNDQDGLRQAKVQIWNDLKSALARIGKTPPPRR